MKEKIKIELNEAEMLECLLALACAHEKTSVARLAKRYKKVFQKVWAGLSLEVQTRILNEYSFGDMLAG